MGAPYLRLRPSLRSRLKTAHEMDLAESLPIAAAFRYLLKLKGAPGDKLAAENSGRALRREARKMAVSRSSGSDPERDRRTHHLNRGRQIGRNFF